MVYGLIRGGDGNVSPCKAEGGRGGDNGTTTGEEREHPGGVAGGGGVVGTLGVDAALLTP